MLQAAPARRRVATLSLLVALVLPVIAACGGTAPQTAAPTTAPAAAATSAPAAAPTAAAAEPTTAAAEPTAATSGSTGGASGGTLKILYWQAPTILNPHQAQGTKDLDAGTVILEALAAYDQDGKPVPFLATEIPTLENGGIAKDNLSITWKLKPNLKWSDGSPLTADDVVFTWQYCANPDTACTTSSAFEPIKSVEAVDPTTVKITWKEPNGNPLIAYVGYNGRVIQKKQFENCIGKKSGVDSNCDAANNKPVANGPYMVTDFKPGDVVTYAKNSNYYNADKVVFDGVEIKGGGDAVSAARAVCETGEVDYAWNLQVQKAVIEQIGQGGKCDLITSGSTGIERIVINFANPDPALGENRSEPNQPHPILSDLKVRQAIALAIDRKAIAEQVYGIGGKVTCNILTQPTALNSTNTKCERDVEKAKQLLDEAGWKDDGTGRKKDGKPLELNLATTINAVRQSAQAIIKSNLAEVGITIYPKAADSGVFFSTDPANPDTFGKFYSDLQMYTNSPASPDPTTYYNDFTCGQIAAKANQWQLGNNGRYCSKDFDTILTQLSTTFEAAKRAELFIKANDTLINDVAVIPLIDRSTPEGKSKELKGPTGTTFDSVLWNIATWSK